MVDPHAIYDGERDHIARFWSGRRQEEFVWTLGPIGERLPHFRVCRVEPADQTEPWIYVTFGAWEAAPDDAHALEFVLLSPTEDPRHVELLALVAYFHLDPRYRLDVGRIMAIGRPWMDDSPSDHLLVALPYPFGPALEDCMAAGKHVRFLWLVPITKAEADLAYSAGLEALEQLLETNQVDVVDPVRPSLVAAAPHVTFGVAD